MPAETNDFRAWIGRTETARDVITAFPYAALSATLDRPAQLPAIGTTLPPLWHWLYFLPLYQQSEAGPDGHIRRGGFLPPVPLPRRMWASSEIVFHEPLRIGDEAQRTSTIEDVTTKAGRTGTLVFVKARHHLRRVDAANLAIDELHTIVYRDAPAPGDTPPAPAQAPSDAAWKRTIVPSDLLLFRYSALTFNGHRIHYDRRYVTEVEGYPGLIVHGPLIATLLLDALRHEHPQAVVRTFEFRAMRPIFDLHPFAVCGQPLPDGRGFRVWAQDHEGCLNMDATVTVA